MYLPSSKQVLFDTENIKKAIKCNPHLIAVNFYSQISRHKVQKQ